MPASVVALSVQAGSGGFDIARQVADQLGFRYYDWEITSEAAARAGVSPTEVIASEHMPGFFERIMRRLAASSTVTLEGGGALAEPSPAIWATALQSMDSDEYRPFIEKVILELADQGDAIIVGHAAQHILREQPGVLKVMLHGAAKERAERLSGEQELNFEQALTNINQLDKDRGDLLKKLYKFDLLDVRKYDLTLSTDQIRPDTAIETIMAAVRGLS